jgi:hypothetical protein
LKVLLVLLALLAGFFEHALGGWAGPTVMALIAVIVPVLLLRTFWNQAWFWVTATLLALLQLPIVLAVRPLIERARSFYMLTFGIADGLLVITLLALACPEGVQSSGRGS